MQYETDGVALLKKLEPFLRQDAARVLAGCEIDDIVQGAYIRLWERWDTISQMDNPAGWVRRDTRFQVLSRIRDLMRERHVLLDVAPTHTTAPRYEPTEAEERLVQALDDEGVWPIAIMYYGQRMSAPTIAKQTGTTECYIRYVLERIKAQAKAATKGLGLKQVGTRRKRRREP